MSHNHFNADVDARSLIQAVQAKGAGYAISQSKELAVIKDISETSGLPWLL